MSFAAKSFLPAHGTDLGPCLEISNGRAVYPILRQSFRQISAEVIEPPLAGQLFCLHPRSLPRHLQFGFTGMAFAQSDSMSNFARFSTSGAVLHGLRMVLLLSVLAAATSADAGQKVSLARDPSPDANVTGYRVYCINVTASHTNQIDVGNTNFCIITNLAEARTYAFYVTAYDASGLESDPSNTLEFTVPLGPIETSFAPGAGGRIEMRLHANGSDGIQLALQTSTDLENWVTLTTAPTAGESIDYTVANLNGDEKRFFRATVVE